MTHAADSATFTTEFGHELEIERQQLLRKRFLWYTGTVIVLSTISSVGTIVYMALGAGGKSEGERETFSVTMAVGWLSLLLYIFAFYHVWRTRRTHWPLLKIVGALIVINGTLALGTTAWSALKIETITRGKVDAAEQSLPRDREAGTGSLRWNDVDAARGETRVVPPKAGDAPVGTTATGNPGGLIDTKAGELLDEIATRKSQHKSKMVTSAIQLSSGIFQIFFTHFFACLFLPWTPRESFRPVVPLLLLNALIALCFTTYAQLSGAGGMMMWLAVGGVLMISPIVALPGAGICWWRASRFRENFTSKLLRGKYVEMRRELVDARRIHESLFPRPILDGPLRFTYFYEPMRQIGGDYLFAFFEPAAVHTSDRLSIVLLDVTGHGIPAALTVNRLYGELSRVFAEQPWIDPGHVLRLLNRYVHLTLANHSVYVTALCMRFDTEQSLIEYASGGHPPAFLRGADGSLHELRSTALVLGACADVDFDPAPAQERFALGDTLIAYTDGALEARPPGGRMLGVRGLLSILSGVRPASGEGWPSTVMREVEAYRQSPPEDDTLIVEVSRPLSGAPAPPSGTAAVPASSTRGVASVVR